MKDIFEIDNFNIIQDDDNYYFFRALNMADNRDVEEGITINEEGKIIRIRTDRERYIENPENGTPKYTEDDEISLEQAHDHIKIHYRKDTNCISLSTDANVVIDYGRGSYKDKYIMIKVPKKEFGEKVRFAGKYLLEEIENRVNDYIANLNPNDKHDIETLRDVEKIDNAQLNEEIKDILKVKYKGAIDTSKSSMKPGIQYRTPVSRFIKYQTLSEEQNLAKNKIVGKLTLLERKSAYRRIIPYESNTNVIATIGRAFSSMELLHYGDINVTELQEVPSKIMDMFSLIQQIKKDMPHIDELKRELIYYATSEKKYQIPEDSILNRHDKAYYLAKSRLKARELASVLDEITGNNPKYSDIIKYIFNNGFRIEPDSITRQNGEI